MLNMKPKSVTKSSAAPAEQRGLPVCFGVPLDLAHPDVGELADLDDGQPRSLTVEDRAAVLDHDHVEDLAVEGQESVGVLGDDGYVLQSLGEQLCFSRSVIEVTT